MPTSNDPNIMPVCVCLILDACFLCMWHVKRHRTYPLPSLTLSFTHVMHIPHPRCTNTHHTQHIPLHCTHISHTPAVLPKQANAAFAPISATHPSSKILLRALTDCLARMPTGADISACVTIMMEVRRGSSAFGIICDVMVCVCLM